MHRFKFGALLVLAVGPAFTAGNSFSGSLERAGNRSLSIRLADRRVIDAMLPGTPGLDAETVAARYRIGDLLEIGCRSIQPVWEEATARYQYLEVTSIRLIRRPSSEEPANLPQRPEGTAPPQSRGPGPDMPGGRELAHAWQVNLEYAANLPNLVADEKAKRQRMGPGSSASRQHIRRDGMPWDQPFEALPGFKWYEGFGTEITPLFEAKCPGTIEYRGRSKVAKRPVLEYDFRAPVDGCFPFFFFEYQRYNPARTGRFSIDESTGNVIQVDERATGFPAEIQFAERAEHVTWDYVKIAGDAHLLPVRANFLVRYNDGTRYRIDVEYKNHRHFETSTSVTFH